MANSVDPGEMLHSAVSHLGLHCLFRPVCPNTYHKFGTGIPSGICHLDILIARLEKNSRALGARTLWRSQPRLQLQPFGLTYFAKIKGRKRYLHKWRNKKSLNLFVSW